MNDRKSETRKRQVVFRELRLLVSNAILRNLIHTNGKTLDISAIAEFQEIVDEYSLAILIAWLGTKYGWNILSPGIDSINFAGPGKEVKADRREVETAVHLTAYPFAGEIDLPDGPHLIRSGQDLLSERLSADPTLIGALYEHMSSHPIVMDAKGSGQIQIDMPHNDKRKIVGQFYTPPSVVRYCYAIAWRKDLMEFMNRITSGAPASDSYAAEAMPRILDPSCGTGNFLAGAIDYLAWHGLAPADLIAFAQRGLFGIELDPRAACLAPFTITLALARALKQKGGAAGSITYEAGKSSVSDSGGFTTYDAGGSTTCDATFAELHSHIKVSDSLYDRHSQHQMDLVITNPPYVSYGARNQPKIAGSHAGFLKSTYPNSSEYKVRTHSIFQEICVNLARPGGKAILLVPDAFLTGSQYKRLRGELLKQATIDSLTELPEDAIAGATVGRWCVASYIRKSGNAQTENKLVDLYSVSTRDRLESCNDENIRQIRFDRHFCVPHAALISRDKQRIHLVFSQQDQAILEIINSLPVLREKLRGHTGMRSLSGRDAIVRRNCIGPSWHRGLESGASIREFEVAWDGHWLNVDPTRLYAGGFDATVIGAAKILLRQTGDTIIAGLDHNGLYHLNNIHSFSPAYCDPCSETELVAFEALLNSAFYRHIYRLRTREDGRALAQIDIDVVEALPLPPPSPPVTDALKKLAERLKLLKGFSTCAQAEKQDAEGRYETGSKIAEGPDEDALKAAIAALRNSMDDHVFQWFNLPAELIKHVKLNSRPILPNKLAKRTVEARNGSCAR